MEYTVIVQPTPNPQALKFVLNAPVKSVDSVVFRSLQDAAAVPLAAALMKIPHVAEVYFSGKFITVSQTGQANWDDLEAAVKAVILEEMPSHNPDFGIAVKKPLAVEGFSGELARINEILDSTIRPALQRDGGDLQLVSLEGNVLTISYQGACGCCPHAEMGTLFAIQDILQNNYKADIVVQMG